MKILIATDCYLFNLGGITASILALSKGLRKQGHAVKILSLSNKFKSYKDGDDYFIRSFKAIYYPGMRTSFAINDCLLKELAEWNPDIIHLQTEGSVRCFANRILKHTNATMIMTCHTDYGHFIFGRYKNNPLVEKIMSYTGRVLYRKATKVTVPSKKATEFPFLKTVKNKIIIVPNGIDLEKYQNKFEEKDRDTFRKSLGIEDNIKVLVSVSRLSKEKNISEIITYFPELLKKYKNVKLLIIGDGPDKGHLEKITKQLGLCDSVIFTGRIPSDEVWQYYAVGDIFVSASTFEVHSMSYLEALANGLPMVCRKDDALIGVVEDNDNGFVYATKKEFINYTYELLKNEKLRKKMANCSYKRALDFSSDVFASLMIKAYKTALSDSLKNRKDK